MSEISGTKLDDAEVKRKRPARKNMLIRIGKRKIKFTFRPTSCLFVGNSLTGSSSVVVVELKSTKCLPFSLQANGTENLERS